MERTMTKQAQRWHAYKAEVLLMKQNFAVIVLGGTGQVGGATVAEMLAIPACREVVMITRKPIAARSRVRNVVLDTGAADFAGRTAALAREVLSQGPASAVSCVGVGSGSMRWSDEELQRLELASSEPLRAAAMMPESPSSACFPQWEAQPTAGFVMSG